MIKAFEIYYSTLAFVFNHEVEQVLVCLGTLLCDAIATDKVSKTC